MSNAVVKLGDVARDVVTGFEGVVVARTEWLHGCRRLTLEPPAQPDGKLPDVQAFDEPRVELVERRSIPDTTGKAKPKPRKTGGPQKDPPRR